MTVGPHLFVELLVVSTVWSFMFLIRAYREETRKQKAKAAKRNRPRPDF